MMIKILPPIPDASIFRKQNKDGAKNEDIKLPKPESNSVTKYPENLVRLFPELRKYFNTNEPTYPNFERLLVELSSIYKDKKIHSAATAFIKLEMYKLKRETYSPHLRLM